MKKVLNLYAGIGGNRKLWKDVDVTAVEINLNIGKIYSDFFPNDELIMEDAHQYLLEHFNEFDFIWSSPPCQTHSQIRFNLGVKNRNTKPIYPDMKLYEEILLLQNYFKGRWVVENTRSFYDPLIKPQYVGSHYFWSNFSIASFSIGSRNHRNGTVETLQERKKLTIDNYDIVNKRQILRNCVEPELGKHVYDCAFKIKQKKLGLSGTDERRVDQ